LQHSLPLGRVRDQTSGVRQHRRRVPLQEPLDPAPGDTACGGVRERDPILCVHPADALAGAVQDAVRVLLGEHLGRRPFQAFSHDVDGTAQLADLVPPAGGDPLRVVAVPDVLDRPGQRADLAGHRLGGRQPEKQHQPDADHAGDDHGGAGAPGTRHHLVVDRRVLQDDRPTGGPRLADQRHDDLLDALRIVDAGLDERAGFSVRDRLSDLIVQVVVERLPHVGGDRVRVNDLAAVDHHDVSLLHIMKAVQVGGERLRVIQQRPAGVLLELQPGHDVRGDAASDLLSLCDGREPCRLAGRVQHNAASQDQQSQKPEETAKQLLPYIHARIPKIAAVFLPISARDCENEVSYERAGSPARSKIHISTPHFQEPPHT
jgi:hypothetical protein